MVRIARWVYASRTPSIRTTQWRCITGVDDERIDLALASEYLGVEFGPAVSSSNYGGVISSVEPIMSEPAIGDDRHTIFAANDVNMTLLKTELMKYGGDGTSFQDVYKSDGDLSVDTHRINVTLQDGVNHDDLLKDFGLKSLSRDNEDVLPICRI